MNEASIEKLLRDSFANYVIQTCLEYADQDQRFEVGTLSSSRLYLLTDYINFSVSLSKLSDHYYRLLEARPVESEFTARFSESNNLTARNSKSRSNSTTKCSILLVSDSSKVSAR